MRRLATISTLAALTTAGVVHANPIDIRVISATYTTSVVTAGSPNYFDSSSHSVPYPVSDSAGFNCTDDDGSPCGFASADARAAAFAASAYTYSLNYGFYASASADTQLTFSPLVDGMTTIGLGFNRVWLDDTSVTASLFDVTDHQLLWGYYWGQTSEGIPLPDLGGFPLSMTQPTALSATHVYRLHLSAESQHSYLGADVNVSGLRVKAVPDAGSSLLLFGISIAGVVAIRSRITHANGPPKF